MKVRNLFVALALTASAFSIGATGVLADTPAPVNNGGDASAPPGCPLGQVRDASGTRCTSNPNSSATTTAPTATAPTATAPTAAAPTAAAPTAAVRSTGTVAATSTGVSTSAAGTGAALANTGTPVTPLLLGIVMLALGGLIVLRTRTTA